ncbi:MAG: hypothetical protein SGILL_002695, partial [Bacillariaceae sp.]
VTPSEDGNVSVDQVEKASIELGIQWKTLVEQRNQSSEEHYKSMLSTLTGLAKDQVKGMRSSTNRYFSTVTTKRTIDGPEGWSIKALEDSIEERENVYAAYNDQTIGGQEVPLVSLIADQPLHESLQGQHIESILSQQNCGAMTESMNDILPLAVPLRPRKSRRCRAELAEGRPGILLKPKLNPLEGDSSLRTGHGQCAMEVLPRARVSIHASDGSRHAFLLKVSNPTLGFVRLRMSGSMYTGENEWNDKTTTSPLLENLLVDPLTQVSVDALVDASLKDAFPVTEICELEAAEDSFLELGKTGDDIPDAVAKWEAGDVLFDSKVSKDTPCSMRLVGKKKSQAWFELVLMEPETVKDKVHCAIPVAMQIEVGDGSWDSSLIQTKHIVEDDPKDFVSFDLLVLWDQFD